MLHDSLTIKIDLDFPTYEEDIARAIRDEILIQVKEEIRKQSKPLRKAIAEKMIADQEQLIKLAIKNINSGK